MDAQTPTGNENKDDVASETPDAGQWAPPVEKLIVDETPAGATDLNLAGRSLTHPLNGFGALWRRTYRVRLTGVAVTPAELVAIWKTNFAWCENKLTTEDTEERRRLFSLMIGPHRGMETDLEPGAKMTMGQSRGGMHTRAL